MYLEILLTIWFVIWLIIKIGLFPDIIKNSWDTADITVALNLIGGKLDRLTDQVTLSEDERKTYAEARVEQHEAFMKEQRRQAKYKGK
jgi:hypothetical protein